LKLKIISIRKAKAEEEKVKTHTQVQRSGFRDSVKVKTMEEWSRDGPGLKSDNLTRGCRLQARGAVQGRNGSRQRVVAHRCGGKEVRLARGGIRERETFLGDEMRGPAGLGGVSMARAR